MPSVTRSQQRFFGQVYSIKTGQIKPSDLDPKYRDQILKAAKDMSLEEIKSKIFYYFLQIRIEVTNYKIKR
jgi:hypothetical protein